MASESSSDDDTPQLSAHALAALQDFYQEQKEMEQMESDPSNSTVFQENWVQLLSACMLRTIEDHDSNIIIPHT